MFYNWNFEHTFQRVHMHTHFLLYNWKHSYVTYSRFTTISYLGAPTRHGVLNAIRTWVPRPFKGLSLNYLNRGLSPVACVPHRRVAVELPISKITHLSISIKEINNVVTSDLKIFAMDYTPKCASHGENIKSIWCWWMWYFAFHNHSNSWLWI